MSGGTLPWRERRRIGPWRLLDLMQATLPWRGGALIGGGAVLPELGPPDAPARAGDPVAELPGSYIGEHERGQAVERERARRFVRARRAGRRETG